MTRTYAHNKDHHLEQEREKMRKRTNHNDVKRLPVALASLLVAAGLSADAAHAHEFPPAFGISGETIQKTPKLYKFQARISQAKMPVPRATFDNVYVKVLGANGDVVCGEGFENIEVRNSVLNLSIGGTMDCDLDEVVAKSATIQFQVCLMTESNCLKPIEVGTVPFATKASFAHQALEAHRSDVSAQSHYAHRTTASRDMLTSGEKGTGYFDFFTPSTGEGLYPDGDTYEPYEDGGFIQWVPVRNKQTKVLNICARDLLESGQEAMVNLDELVLASELTSLRGNAVIEGDAVTKGAAMIEGAATTLGHHQAQGGLTVAGDSGFVATTNAEVRRGIVVVKGTASTALDVRGNAAVSDSLTVDNGVTVATGALDAQQGASIRQGLTVTQEQAEKALDVTGATDIHGRLTITSAEGETQESLAVGGGASVQGGLVVGDVAGTEALSVEGNAVFEQGVSIQGGLGGELSCEGPATFGGNVSIGNSAGEQTDVQVAATATTTFEGPVHLKGSVTTDFPITNVVRTVNNSSGIGGCNPPGVPSTDVSISRGNDDHPILFCALIDVQMPAGNAGRCRVLRQASGDWTLKVIGEQTCCYANCF